MSKLASRYHQSSCKLKQLRHRLDEFENLQKSIISLLRRCCSSSIDDDSDDQGKIYSLTSLLFKIMRTPRRLCDVKILIDLLYILSSKSFTSYIIQENLRKELNSVVEDFIDIIRDWWVLFIALNEGIFVTIVNFIIQDVQKRRGSSKLFSLRCSYPHPRQSLFILSNLQK